MDVETIRNEETVMQRKPKYTNITIRLGDLVVYEANPKFSTKAQGLRLIQSEKEFGQPMPFTVSPYLDDGKRADCYDGNQRLAAWRTAYGDDFEVAARQSDRHFTDEERAKFALTMHTATGSLDWNKLSAWDAEKVVEWVGGDDKLKEWNNDALNYKELKNSEQPELDAEPQIDRAAELAEKWGCKSGDLWTLGQHRLLIGDCTVRENVERLMGGERAGACVTDPPYGIGYEYDAHDDKDSAKNDDLVRGAFLLAPECIVWTCGMMNTARELTYYPNAKILCWHKGFAQAGSGLGGASTWEPVLVVGAKKATLPNDYLHFSTDREKGLRELHSCPKPIKLFEHLIKHLTDGIIYEPFGGSGTTMVACNNLGRKCRMIEIDPKYGAVILQRMSDLGVTPVLAE